MTTFYEDTLPTDFVFNVNGNASASDLDEEILGLTNIKGSHPGLLDEGIQIIRDLSGDQLSSIPNTTLGKQFAKSALIFNQTTFPFNITDPGINVDTASITASKCTNAIQSAIYQDVVNVTSSQTSLLGLAGCYNALLSKQSQRDFLSAGKQIFNGDTANTSISIVFDANTKGYDCQAQSQIDIRASMDSTQPSSHTIRHLIGKDSFTKSGNGTFYPLQTQNDNFAVQGEAFRTMQDAKVIASQASFYRTYAAGFVVSARVNATMYDRYADLSIMAGIANGTDTASIHVNRLAVRYYTVLAVVNNCTNS